MDGWMDGWRSRESASLTDICLHICFSWFTDAVEILLLVGFSEDVGYDETGKADTCLVLKRNDPGLLSLSKPSLEACMA